MPKAQRCLWVLLESLLWQAKQSTWNQFMLRTFTFFMLSQPQFPSPEMHILFFHWSCYIRFIQIRKVYISIYIWARLPHPPAAAHLESLRGDMHCALESLHREQHTVAGGDADVWHGKGWIQPAPFLASGCSPGDSVTCETLHRPTWHTREQWQGSVLTRAAQMLRALSGTRVLFGDTRRKAKGDYTACVQGAIFQRPVTDFLMSSKGHILTLKCCYFPIPSQRNFKS